MPEVVNEKEYSFFFFSNTLTSVVRLQKLVSVFMVELSFIEQLSPLRDSLIMGGD